MDMSHGMQEMKMKGKTQPERGHASALPVETPDLFRFQTWISLA
jgi:hypothetical protein